MEEENKKKNNTNIVLIIVISILVLIIIGGGIGAFFIFNNLKNDKADDKEVSTSEEVSNEEEKRTSENNMNEQEINTFNDKFTPYEGKIRGSQVNALAQAVITNNLSVAENGEEATKGIKMTGEGINIAEDGSTTSVKKLSPGTYYTTTFTYKNSLVHEIIINTSED